MSAARGVALSVAVAVATLTGVWVSAAGAGESKAGGDGVVTVATTGDHSELRETVPIARRARGKVRVAMSLPPRKMPSLIEGDRLRVTAELQTTNNCSRRSSYCVSRPYRYSPKIGARLVLARRRNATAGPRVKAISDWRVRACDQNRSHREHHCMRVFTGSGFDVPAADALPCRPAECRVNLVVEAHHPKARSGDVVILGIDRKDGRVSGDRGRLNAIRFRGRGVPVRKRTDTRRRRSQVPIRRGEKSVIYSMRLPNLRRGEQLSFQAAAHIGIGHLSYSAFVGSQLVLGTNRQATHTTEFTRRVATLQGEVTEANGFNCTQRATPCPAPKVGTLRIRRDAKRGDRAVPLYVNYVVRNAPKQVDAESGDAMRVLPGGFIKAWRYPPRARG